MPKEKLDFKSKATKKYQGNVAQETDIKASDTALAEKPNFQFRDSAGLRNKKADAREREVHRRSSVIRTKVHQGNSPIPTGQRGSHK
uniref:Uncharacterized protein n=1 Tax=Nelumbo nucifera TaxID=4432 RepID=A0A822Z981_NELNU|nr:TPA_asm: hypothetical protein HUJ06_015446 [Nelumbo nucifera]